MMVVDKDLLFDIGDRKKHGRRYQMSELAKTALPHIHPRQVWARLAVEQRSPVIRLMAQLAFNFIVAQTTPFKQEAPHVMVQPAKDSNPAS